MLADFHAPQPTAPVNRGQASRSTRLPDPRRTQPRCPERTCPGPPRSAAPQLPGSAPVGRGPHKAGLCRPLGSCRSVRRGLRPPAVARRPSRPACLSHPRHAVPPNPGASRITGQERRAGFRAGLGPSRPPVVPVSLVDEPVDVRCRAVAVDGLVVVLVGERHADVLPQGALEVGLPRWTDRDRPRPSGPGDPYVAHRASERLSRGCPPPAARSVRIWGRRAHGRRCIYFPVLSSRGEPAEARFGAKPESLHSCGRSTGYPNEYGGFLSVFADKNPETDHRISDPITDVMGSETGAVRADSGGERRPR